MIPTPASQGTEAIHAAGVAVRAWTLDSTEAIRRAIPTARQAAVALKSRSESSTWQTGRFTGLPIAIYQNWLCEMNRAWRFTDGTLCVLWCVEFPDARSDYAEKRHYIASTRRDYNSGKHQAPAPAEPCVEYDILGTPTSSAQPRRAAAPSAPPVAQPKRSPATAPSPRPTSPVAAHTKATRPSAPVDPFELRSDPTRTASRIAALDAYMAKHVLGPGGFCCTNFQACRGSHLGEFFEGQLHHVGSHYDLTLNGRPFRIAVVGQEYGNGPGDVTRQVRTHDVVQLTGYGKRFRSDGIHRPRNPHMRGTTSLLRLLMGRALGSEFDGEMVSCGASPVHIFEAFALTNFLLCSAIAAGQGDIGSKRGKSTPTMQRNCARHFGEMMAILEPTIVVAQGKSVREWMNLLIEQKKPLGPNLDRVRLGGRECLLASFTHPSVPSSDNWGTDERRPYLLDVVAPAVGTIRMQVATG